MAFGTFSSRILGFLRDAIMFALFPRGVTDAWVVAFKLPNLFRRLLGEGSLSPSFIPVYVEAREKSPEHAKRLVNGVFTILLAVSIAICVACFIYMDELLWYLVGDPRGFASVPGKVEQTIYLARIMIFYLLLVSIYAFHMAIANTLGHFFWPAVGPTLFNLGLIIFTVLPFEVGRYPGSLQSYGVIFGGLLQAGIVVWILLKEKCLPRISFKPVGPEVRKVFANMIPGLIGTGIFQVMTIVNTKFAARLAEGSQTYIYAADRILELPQSLIAVSLGAALLPRFSELESAGNRQGFLQEANKAVCLLLFLSLPAAVGMWVLSQPITEVLFMRGAFNASDAARTSQIVEIYAVLLLFSSWSRISAPAFYALKNTWLPALVALFVLALHISLGPYLVDHYGLKGLAVATSASSILNIFILQVFFFLWIGPLGYGKILISVARLLPALVVMGLFCHYVYPVCLELFKALFATESLNFLFTGSESLARILSLFLVISFSVVLYFVLTRLSGSESARKISSRLKPIR